MAENMIKFLRGNVASLPQTATAGAVYFTKDEGLYLGLEDGSYHRYGDFITVANVAALPSTGAHETCMYYCEAENILAKWDGAEWVQINKQKTLEQLGGVAKSVYEAKMALLEKADTDNATAISDLTAYVGTVPNGEDGQPVAASVIAYINKKTDGIATSGNLEALGARVTTAEGEIDALQAALAEGGDTAKAIGEAQAAADAAQGEIDALEEKVGTVEDGKTVVGLIEAAQEQADKGVADAATAQAKADSAYTLAEGKATMEEVEAAIADAGHAVQTEVDQAFADMETAYKAADTALETKLQGNIDKKVESSVYEAKVAEIEKAIADEQARAEGIEGGLETRLAKVEGDYLKAADKTELQGNIDAVAGAVELLTNGVKADEVDGVNDLIQYVKDHGAVVTGMQEGIADNAGAIADLAEVIGKEAEGEAEATGLVKDIADNAAAIAAEKARAEGKEAELAQAIADEATTARAAEKVNADAIAAEVERAEAEEAAIRGELATAIEGAKTDAADKDAVVLAEAQKGITAVQTALDEHVGDTVAHITADERTAWNAAEGNAKAYADGLKATIDAAYAAADAALKTELQGYADQSEADAKAYADGLKATIDAAYVAADSALKTELQGYADTAEADAVATAKAYSESLLVWGSF